MISPRLGPRSSMSICPVYYRLAKCLVLTSPQKPEDDANGLLPPQHWAQLNEVSERRYLPYLKKLELHKQDADDQDDADSILSDNGSSTASLSSSILKYRTLHGRLYQSEKGNPDYWFVEMSVYNDWSLTLT